MLASEARRRFRSERLLYGLRRNLEVPFDAPKAKIDLTIRPLRPLDVRKLLDLRGDTHGSQIGAAPRALRVHVRMQRLQFLEQGVGTCWVAALSHDDEPCYMQWLIPASDNARIASYFGGIFPRLEPDEALLEYAFTPERLQGQGIMAAAMARIAEQGKTIGARRVITFVDHANGAALKGCHRAGFAEYLQRRDRWRFFRRNPVFEPLPPDFSDSVERA